MNYDEALSYMLNVSKSGSVYGLESIIRLMDKLGNPQDKLKFVHVSGTNGKGSTIAFISTILKEAGLKVGRYVSPTVICYRERIQVNEEFIDEASFAELVTKVKKACDEIVAEGHPHPTAFELDTAVSFLYFLNCKCDIVVLETGMGGRLDGTNLIKTTLVSVIASISMDHMGFLGNTIYEIATNKAGIIKKGAVVVTANQEPDAMKAIYEEAKLQGCEVRIADRNNISNISHEGFSQRFSYKGIEKEFADVSTSLLGTYQMGNAILAIEAVCALRNIGYKISDNAIYNGLNSTKWVGRFTKILENPLFFVDGAHNEDAAIYLRETIDTYFTNRKKVYIMGVLADKEYRKIINTVITGNDMVVTVTPGNPRALDSKELAREIKCISDNVVSADSVAEGVKTAIKKADEDSVVIAFGSLYYLGEVIEAVNQLKERK